MTIMEVVNPLIRKPRLRHPQLTPPLTWTELGLWAVFFLGAFLGAFKRYAPVPASIISLAYDILCFGLLTYVLARRVLHSRRVPYSPATLPLFVFCGYTLVTILNPEVTSLARGLLGWRFLASSILFHCLGFYAFDDTRRLWRLLTFFFITGGLVAAYGIVQLVRGYTPIELEWISNLPATMRIAGTGRYRLMSTMGGAVDLGFFMALTMTSLLGIIVVRKQRNITHLALFGLMATALVFTFVRAAWVAVFIGGVYIMTVHLWQFKRLRLLFPSLLIVGIITIAALPFIAGSVAHHLGNPALQERVGSLAKPFEDRSMRDRFNKWKEIWQVVERYPLGIGVGMTGATSLKYPNDLGPAPVTMDNSYLKVLVETGWIGLGLFVWLLATIVRRGMRLPGELHGGYRALALLLAGCFISYVVILLFGEYIELNPARSIIWIFSGFLFSLPRLQRIASIGFQS